jgi:hypothetical protein
MALGTVKQWCEPAICTWLGDSCKGVKVITWYIRVMICVYTCVRTHTHSTYPCTYRVTFIAGPEICSPQLQGLPLPSVFRFQFPINCLHCRLNDLVIFPIGPLSGSLGIYASYLVDIPCYTSVSESTKEILETNRIVDILYWIL